MTFFNNLRLRQITVHHSICLLFLLILVTGCQRNTPAPAGSRTVEIRKGPEGYRFYKNGQPLLVKGAVGHTHLAELAASGGNTILIWDTTLLEKALSEAARHQIQVIAGLDIPSGDIEGFYKDTLKVNKLFNAYSRIVQQYKNHPALLAWALGNELIFPISARSGPFYKTYNRFLDMIHRNDPDHPVTTTLINYNKQSLLNIQWKVHNLDFISINTYNKLKEMKSKMKKFELLWDGPFLISEWSPNGGWESETTVWQAPIENTSTKKAEQYAEFYKHYMPVDNPRFLGSLVFYWGSRHEYTHTWYSIFEEDGTPNEIQEVLRDAWKGNTLPRQSVNIQYMLVDTMGARSNILLSPGSVHSAQLLLGENEPGDSLRYAWEILREDWLNWGRTWHYFKRPAAEQGLISDSTLRQIRFTSPVKEGPYRIFVYVFNKKGYVSTANTPFYVVNNEL